MPSDILPLRGCYAAWCIPEGKYLLFRSLFLSLIQLFIYCWEGSAVSELGMNSFFQNNIKSMEIAPFPDPFSSTLLLTQLQHNRTIIVVLYTWYRNYFHMHLGRQISFSVVSGKLLVSFAVGLFLKLISKLLWSWGILSCQSSSVQERQWEELYCLCTRCNVRLLGVETEEGLPGFAERAVHKHSTRVVKVAAAGERALWMHVWNISLGIAPGVKAANGSMNSLPLISLFFCSPIWQGTGRSQEAQRNGLSMWMCPCLWGFPVVLENVWSHLPLPADLRGGWVKRSLSFLVQ